jgi:hypothetical protein
MVNDMTRLLGLASLAVTGVADGPDGPVVQLVTADEQARRCQADTGNTDLGHEITPGCAG